MDREVQARSGFLRECKGREITWTHLSITAWPEKLKASSCSITAKLHEADQVAEQPVQAVRAVSWIAVAAAVAGLVVSLCGMASPVQEPLLVWCATQPQ